MTLARVALTIVLLAAVAPAQPDAAVDKALSRAHALLAKKQFEKGLAGFQRVLEVRPASAPAHCGAGRCLIHLRRYAEAIDLLEKAEQKFAKSATIAMLLGQVYYHEARRLMDSNARHTASEIKFRLIDAAAKCDRAIKLDPNLHGAFYYKGLARLYLDPPDVDAALKALRAVPNEKRDPPFYFHLALMYTQAGKHAEAGKAYWKCAELARDREQQHDACVRAGTSYARAGDPEATAKAFKRALVVAMRERETFDAIWSAFAGDAKQREAGVALLEKLHEARPSSPFPRFYLGFLLRHMDKITEARQAFESVVRTKEGAKFSEAWAMIGQCWLTAKDEKKAEASSVKALEVAAANQTALKTLRTMVGDAYRSRDLKRSEQLTRVILRFRPNDGLEWANLGLFLRDQRRYETSWIAYRKAARLAPDHAQTQNDAGVVLHYHLGRVPEAEKLYRRAVDLDPNTIDALENLGVIHFDRGQDKAALGWLEKVLALQPRRGKALRYVKRIQDRAGADDPGN